MEFANIAGHLPVMARRQPFVRAVVFPEGRNSEGRVTYSQLTYEQLDHESDRIAAGLEASGVSKGTLTVLMVKPSLDFFALTFALFKVGAVPVLIDPGLGLRHVGKCLAEVGPQAFIGIPKAHLARLLLGWGRKTLRILITVGERYAWDGITLNEVKAAAKPWTFRPEATAAGDMAAILFTSGSTGVPKGTVYTHGMFADQVEKLRALYDIQPGEIDLPTFPLFALFAPALGMTAVIPDMDPTRPAKANPEKIIEAIQDCGVTTMFGSPALINRVGRYGAERGVKLPSLKRVISAGAPVSGEVIARFVQMLKPGVELHTPYGATEALPVSSIASDEILGSTASETARGQGVCVGLPVPGMTVRIVPISDVPIVSWSDELSLGKGEIGEIVVRGGNVTESYYNRPESTALAKIPDPVSGFFHRMGDVGYLDGKGRLWFCGRKSHRVITDAGTLFTIPCEGIFNAHPAVFRTALVGVRREGRTVPVICVELENSGADSDQGHVRPELALLGEKNTITRDIKIFLFHQSFPVDIRHNAKIFREKLAVWAQREVDRGAA